MVGSKEAIERAHRYRKIYGGGMRQAGLLAAAGIYALDFHRQLLAEDHIRAKKLGEELARLSGVEVDLESLQTNIVIADFNNTKYAAAEVTEKLAQKGILCLPFSKTRVRFVTHLDVDDAGIERAINALGFLFK